jgi:hypothetical protein
MAAEKEVRAEPAVEILDHGTGADGLLGQFGHDHAERKEAAAQSCAQHGFPRPSRRMIHFKGFGIEQLTQRRWRKLKARSRGYQP